MGRIPQPLSIIVVNWNTLAMLRACLASIYRSVSFLEVEVIVVDNASTDRSAEMVEAEFPEAVLIRNDNNRGFAAANNQALAIASGRYVLLLNSDTVVHGDVLSRSIGYMELNPDVAIMGCRVLNADGTMQPTCSRFPTILNLLLLTSGLSKLPWPRFLDRYQMRRWNRTDEREVEVVSGCYMMVRAQAERQVGMLDEDFFFFGEETDWCRRFRSAGWKLRFVPVGEITHYGGGSSGALNYRRDLLLSNALVKLHKKHMGFASAASVWLLLWAFNASRACFWTLRFLVGGRKEVAIRRNHFVQVVRRFDQAWTTVETA